MDKLYILWTNSDFITSRFMVFMYAANSIKQEWWREVTIIIWGSTAILVKENSYIQKELKSLMKTGVNVIACKSCADKLGASSVLVELGVEVDYLGTYLTDIIKDPEKNLITV